MRTPARRGFSLLELMTVVTIISILAVLSVTTAQQIGARNATQNAASDLSTVLQSARARAEQYGSEVYVLVYPKMRKSDGSLTAGVGAIFVYEDIDGNFLTSTGACDGTSATCGWANFVPPNRIRPGSKDRLIQALYLEDYAGANVRFGKISTATFKAPFTSVGTLADSNGCSFCAATKGAVVFTGEQQLRFLDNTGAPVAQRVAGLSLQGVKSPDNTFLFGLVGATGLVTAVK